MAFNKLEAKENVKNIQKAHPGFLRLAACVRVEAEMPRELTHFSPSTLAVKHKNLHDLFHAFRKMRPYGQYLLIVTCGDDVPENPPPSQPVRRALAKLRGTFEPARECVVLKLDTNWLDKAFGYQKRLNYFQTQKNADARLEIPRDV